MHRFFYVILLVTLCACATKPPAPISRVPPGNLNLAEVKVQPNQHISSEVRWGGTIVKVENKAEQTWVEIVQRSLTKDAKPNLNSKSSGRFIASFPGFVDPVVYEQGRLLTIIGNIDSELIRPIGEFNYPFLLVTVTSSYLWPKEVEYVRQEIYPPPWWGYDPWPYYYRTRPHHHD